MILLSLVKAENKQITLFFGHFGECYFQNKKLYMLRSKSKKHVWLSLIGA